MANIARTINWHEFRSVNDSSITEVKNIDIIKIFRNGKARKLVGPELEENQSIAFWAEVKVGYGWDAVHTAFTEKQYCYGWEDEGRHTIRLSSTPDHEHYFKDMPRFTLIDKDILHAHITKDFG